MNTSAIRILLVAKEPLAKRLDPEELARIEQHGAIDLQRLRNAALNHDRTMQTVRRCLIAHHIHEWQVDRLQPSDAHGMDLVVTVGGDGTVLTANSLSNDLPMLTVNSDPEGSVGMYTRCTASTFPALFEQWLAGSARIETIPRLQVQIDSGPPNRILNECLIASVNPAAMTRYLLEVPGPHGWDGRHRELQRSSGLWVATAAGSTAAIHSAGATVVDAHTAALLFQVREPFQLQGRLALLSGHQVPPQGLRVVPGMPGISIFIDGPYLQRSVAAGAVVEFAACPTPLRLVSSSAA